MATQQDWGFLKGTYWYVPDSYLPALQMNTDATAPMRMIDQTVWQILGCENGYLWGNCAALIYEEGTTPTSNPTGLRMQGSITPTGGVQISFMPINPIGAAMSISGWGNMCLQQKEWAFEMQMSSGVTALVSHWAYMRRTQEGDLSWKTLPGTEYSVPDFLTAAGF